MAKGYWLMERIIQFNCIQNTRANSLYTKKYTLIQKKNVQKAVHTKHPSHLTLYEIRYLYKNAYGHENCSYTKHLTLYIRYWELLMDRTIVCHITYKLHYLVHIIIVLWTQKLQFNCRQNTLGISL